MEIKKFNPRIFENKINPIIGVFGPSSRGKTFLINDILQYFKNNSITFLSRLGRNEEYYYKQHSSNFHNIYKDYNDINNNTKLVINDIIRNQKNKIIEDKDFNTTLVIDPSDNLDLNNFYQLFMNSQRWKISLIITGQYIKKQINIFKSHFSHLFIFKESIEKHQKILHKLFFGFFDKFSDFKTILMNLGENECLVIDNTIKSNNISDYLFWYKATLNTL